MTLLNASMRRMWNASRSLTATGVLMLAVLLLTLAGPWLAPGTVTGMPAWLKPAKFALSSAIYALTFAWIFTYLGSWPRLTRIVGRTTAVVLLIENGIIDAQAARGVTSHFNVSTPLDASLFAIMGVSIVVAWAMSIVLAVAVFRQRFADDVLGWAIRLGLLITVFGSATGGLMTQPTHGQISAMRAGERITTSGAHTVGAPDGGPGLPGTGWSTAHGDMRIPHFLGLHGAQIIPLLLWLRRRVGRGTARRSSVIVAATSYASLFVILLWQALRGQALVAPDRITLIAFGVWLAATVLAVAMASERTYGADRDRRARTGAMVSL